MERIGTFKMSLVKQSRVAIFSPKDPQRPERAGILCAIEVIWRAFSKKRFLSEDGTDSIHSAGLSVPYIHTRSVLQDQETIRKCPFLHIRR